jgi:FkbM family methyltransferase
MTRARGLGFAANNRATPLKTMPTTVPILFRLIWQHPANRNHRIWAVGKAALWQAYKRTIRRPFDLRVYDGLRLRAYADSHEPGRFIYFGGLPDYDEMTFIRRYLRPGDHFIDGGANVGAYTLLAASLVGQSGRVDAFEPSPLEASRLRENIERNALAQVRVHEAALAEEPGRADFTIDRSSGNRLRRNEDEGSAVKIVEVATIDNALPLQYAMAKLDLEGAEPLALQGAEHHLAAGSPPVLLLEIVDRFLRRFGSSASELGDWLHERGYELATYDADRNRLNVVGSAFAASRTNMFALLRRKLPSIASRLGAAVSRGAAP